MGAIKQQRSYRPSVLREDNFAQIVIRMDDQREPLCTNMTLERSAGAVPNVSTRSTLRCEISVANCTLCSNDKMQDYS